MHFIDWDEQVTSWFNSVMWVPHHVSALCAALVGFIALTARGRATAARVLLAALAFASMVGQSAYVAMPAALGAALLARLAAVAAPLRHAARLCVAGLGALALAAPWLSTLLPRFGGDGPSPIGFHLRGPEWIDIVAGSEQAGALYRGLCHADVLSHRLRRVRARRLSVLAQGGATRRRERIGAGCCCCLTAASFLIGSLLRSTILFNDLGWRVMLFAQFAALMWTAAAARQGLLFRGGMRYAAGGGLALGYAALVVAMIQLRSFFPYDHMRATLARRDGRLELARSRICRMAPSCSPARSTSRAYGYGLYGRFPVALADRHNGGCSARAGADRDAPCRSCRRSSPMRRSLLTMCVAAPSGFGIAALVVSSQDAVFAAPGAWTAAAKPDYANPNFRIYLLNTVRHVATN